MALQHRDDARLADAVVHQHLHPVGPAVGEQVRMMRADLPLLLAIPMPVVTKVGVRTAMRAQDYLLIPEEVKSPAVLRRAWLHARARHFALPQAA